MAKWTVEWQPQALLTVDVEADDAEQAEELAAAAMNEQLATLRHGAARIHIEIAELPPTLVERRVAD